MQPEDDGNQRVNWSSQQLLEAYEECLDVLDEYEFTEAMHACAGENPYAQRDVQEAHILLHLAVLRCWRRMPRAKVRDKLPQYWHGVTEIDGEKHEIIIMHEGPTENKTGLKWLDAFQSAPVRYQSAERRRHEGMVEVTDWDVELLPVDKCRQCINYFNEILEQLGVINPPDEGIAVSEPEDEQRTTLNDDDPVEETSGLPVKADGGVDSNEQ